MGRKGPPHGRHGLGPLGRRGMRGQILRHQTDAGGGEVGAETIGIRC